MYFFTSLLIVMGRTVFEVWLLLAKNGVYEFDYK